MAIEINQKTAKQILSKYPRDDRSYKWDYGHLLVSAGSIGMMGACVLVTRAAYRTGAGKVTASIPKDGFVIMQVSVPETIVRRRGQDFADKEYTAVVAGPGIGKEDESRVELIKIMNLKIPTVIDADGLNLIAEDQSLLEFLHKSIILTPHITEFQRVFGGWDLSFNELVKMQIDVAKRYSINIVLKSHRTSIVDNEGNVFILDRPDSSIATAGTGDVLTGIIGGFLAQGFNLSDSMVFGAYIHNDAGRNASLRLGQRSVMAKDVISYLPVSLKEIEG